MNSTIITGPAHPAAPAIFKPVFKSIGPRQGTARRDEGRADAAEAHPCSAATPAPWVLPAGWHEGAD